MIKLASMRHWLRPIFCNDCTKRAPDSDMWLSFLEPVHIEIGSNFKYRDAGFQRMGKAKRAHLFLSQQHCADGSLFL